MPETPRWLAKKGRDDEALAVLSRVGVGIMAAALVAITTLMSDVSGGHGILLIALILVYIAAYASSIACLTWVVLSEIFPNRIRGEAMSVANLCLWTANFLLLLTFPIIQGKFGLAAPFAAYAAICAVIVPASWNNSKSRRYPAAKISSSWRQNETIRRAYSLCSHNALRINAHWRSLFRLCLCRLVG